jgi:hypothetical protein
MLPSVMMRSTGWRGVIVAQVLHLKCRSRNRLAPPKCVPRKPLCGRRRQVPCHAPRLKPQPNPVPALLYSSCHQALRQHGNFRRPPLMKQRLLRGMLRKLR